MNSGASLSLQTERLASETGNVQGSVDVPMMFGTAIATHPAPDPKTFQPSRAADASTRRTGSGCTRFIDFQMDHPRVIVFVSEVVPQHRPSGIEHALRHATRGFAVSYPRDLWYIRVGVWFENALRRWRANPFRMFVHPASRMEILVRGAGFELVSRRRTWMWSADVFRKNILLKIGPLRTSDATEP